MWEGKGRGGEGAGRWSWGYVQIHAFLDIQSGVVSLKWR